MAEPGRPSFHESWEQTLAKHRERISAPQEKEQQKEVLREVVREEMEVARAPQPVPQAPAPVPAQPPPVKKIALKAMPDERQVQYLAEMALSEGLEPAVTLAQELDSPYVLDAFHDRLVDELWEELIKRWNLNPRE